MKESANYQSCSVPSQDRGERVLQQGLRGGVRCFRLNTLELWVTNQAETPQQHLGQLRPASHGGPGKSFHSRHKQDSDKLSDKCSGACKHTQNLLMDGVSNFFFCRKEMFCCQMLSIFSSSQPVGGVWTWNSCSSSQYCLFVRNPERIRTQRNEDGEKHKTQLVEINIIVAFGHKRNKKLKRYKNHFLCESNLEEDLIKPAGLVSIWEIPSCSYLGSSSRRGQRNCSKLHISTFAASLASDNHQRWIVWIRRSICCSTES